MFHEKLAEVAELLDKELPVSTKRYLQEKLPNGRPRLDCNPVRGGGVRLFLTRYPDLKWTIEDLKGIDSVEKEDNLANRNKINKEEKEVIEDAKAENLKPGDPELDQMIDERSANKFAVYDNLNNPTDELKESPDMLVGTGLTGIISDKPVVDGTRFQSDGEPDMVKAVKEAYPNGPVEEPKKAEPMVSEAPTLVPNKYAKKYTLTNKKESGIADAIVLSIIVIVYVAIIVNLIIRLK